MSKKNKLLIIGAGGHGKVVADIALKTMKWNEISYIDDDTEKKMILGFNIIDIISNTFKYINEYDVLIAIGNNEVRETIQNNLEKQGASIPILIHPTAVIGKDVQISSGSIVMANAVINSCTQIGKGCIINTAAIVEHDNKIGNFVHISPNATTGGNVNIGDRTWLGLSSTVKNNVEICKDCVIGASGLVLNNIHKPGLYVGIPAILTNENDS